MSNRKEYNSLRLRMEEVGFQFEREQKPHHQNRHETEFKFVHPRLIKKLEDEGYNVRAKKFYIKPLSSEPNCEIGFVTGKSSPLFELPELPELPDLPKPNASDSFDETPAWINSVSDNALDKLLLSVKSLLDAPSNHAVRGSDTFLFAWNPKRWDWKDLQENIDSLESVGYFNRKWSCGNSTSIKKGDRVFLIRLGEDPKGIMGSGYAKSSYYVAPHWDGSEGKSANYIDIEFDILINPEKGILFDKERLVHTDQKSIQQWFPQQSGISIKTKVAEVLERNWLKFTIKNNFIGNGFVSNDSAKKTKETFTEGLAIETAQTRYERNPHARRVCLSHHGYSCQICDFNFFSHFGEIGKDFIHVHHINPIAAIGGEYKINPEKDLIPVCPNCHSMIHSKRPAFTIEEIKKIRKCP